MDEAPALPGFEERVVHPEFRGLEFLHVRAKRLLNEVTGAPSLPFRWTINVYRGCSHDCSYCQAPDTPVLMGDGRVRRLADLRVGDKVVGTVRRGRSRRYVRTEVLDHWSSIQHAYRVTLEDGTELVASGVHRYLTQTGWKHVIGAEHGPAPRPHLTTDDSLVGVGDIGAEEGARGGRGAVAVESRTRLRVAAIEDLGIEMPMYDITTGTGDFIASGVVSHNCFARPSHAWLELDPARDFGRVIVVKINAVERLRAELRSPSWPGEHVALGTNTDPYQRCEGRYRLTRGVVSTLAEAGNSFSVLTKGTLVTRDLDVLADAARRGICSSVSLSIPTLDEDLWRASEPGTPHPRARMETVAALAQAGIPAGVMVAPIIPGLSDAPEQLDAVVRTAVDAGASSVTPIVLHLRPGVKEVFSDWLRQRRPELVERYERLYAGSYAPKEVRKRIAGTVGRLVERHGGMRPPTVTRRRTTSGRAGGQDPTSGGGQGAAPADRPAPEAEQLGLL